MTKQIVKLSAKENNYAFIDSQNLNLGTALDVYNKDGRRIYKGTKLDFKRFRDYLRQKYNVTHAYIFIGMIPGNNSLYSYLQEAGYIVVFKQIAWHIDEDGKVIVKGNVDTDIVLYAAAKLINKYDQAIFVSGDGDFLSLYEHIEAKGKLKLILVPNRHKYSRLLNQYRHKLRFVSDLKSLAQTNKKTKSGGRNKSLDLLGHGDKKTIAENKQNSNKKRSSLGNEPFGSPSS
jgi:uncharacterized LabA/DUF88 family protein